MLEERQTQMEGEAEDAVVEAGGEVEVQRLKEWAAVEAVKQLVRLSRQDFAVEPRMAGFVEDRIGVAVV